MWLQQVELAETVGAPHLGAIPLFAEAPALMQRTCLLLKDTVALAGAPAVMQAIYSVTCLHMRIAAFPMLHGLQCRRAACLTCSLEMTVCLLLGLTTTEAICTFLSAV